MDRACHDSRAVGVEVKSVEDERATDVGNGRLLQQHDIPSLARPAGCTHVTCQRFDQGSHCWQEFLTDPENVSENWWWWLKQHKRWRLHTLQPAHNLLQPAIKSGTTCARGSPPPVPPFGIVCTEHEDDHVGSEFPGT